MLAGVALQGGARTSSRYQASKYIIEAPTPFVHASSFSCIKSSSFLSFSHSFTSPCLSVQSLSSIRAKLASTTSLDQIIPTAFPSTSTTVIMSLFKLFTAALACTVSFASAQVQPVGDNPVVSRHK